MLPSINAETKREVYTKVMVNESIFKAYDIRGVYPTEINEDAAYGIAQAYAKFLNAKTVVLGRDVRVSGPSLFQAVAQGLMDHGVNVIDIGVVTTDMMYFAAANYPCDGGITVSASHNPKEYNGLKLVRKGAVPISGDTGINEIKKLVQEGYRYEEPLKGVLQSKEITQDYLKKCLSFINAGELKSLRVVANAMFGPALQNVMKAKLPILLMMLNEVPDGTFPKGQPDPLQEKNQAETIALIQEKKPDMGVAWDADADRFFLFDENGRNIPGYYLTAFLGKYFADKIPGAKIIHDPRLTWAVEEEVRAVGGVAIASKCGHSFIKERMRKEDVVFAGEMSGHYYFRDFYFCDNGLIPFLMILEIVSKSGKKVSELFNHYFEKYPISGEINIKLAPGQSVPEMLARIEKTYPDAKIQKIDGLSLEYPTWRANVRGSNTEPLLRLNMEARDRITLERELPKLKALTQ
jgi:phosphomannomutase